MNSAAGVIFAQNTVTGEAIRDDLGLTDWIVVSPRSIDRLRGRTIEPRLLVVSSSDMYSYRDELITALGTDQPALYWLTGGAL